MNAEHKTELITFGISPCILQIGQSNHLNTFSLFFFTVCIHYWKFKPKSEVRLVILKFRILWKGIKIIPTVPVLIQNVGIIYILILFAHMYIYIFICFKRGSYNITFEICLFKLLFIYCYFYLLILLNFKHLLF